MYKSLSDFINKEEDFDDNRIQGLTASPIWEANDENNFINKSCEESETDDKTRNQVKKEPKIKSLKQNTTQGDNKRQSLNEFPKHYNLGRKRKNCDEPGKHTKSSKDNMLKKIKNYHLNEMRLFVNEAINFHYKTNEDKEKLIDKNFETKKKDLNDLIKNLEYQGKIFSTYKNKDNLELLDKPLGEIISSTKISTKNTRFISVRETWNKQIIEKIKENGNENLDCILNKMAFKDFININLEKKQLKDYPGLDENFKNNFKYFENSRIKAYFRGKNYNAYNDADKEVFKNLMYGYEEYYKKKLKKKK